MKKEVCVEPPSDEGAGVQWTPLQSRSTDRGGNRDGGFCEAKDGGREQQKGVTKATFLSFSFAYAQQPLTAAVSLCHFVTSLSHSERVYPRQREPRWSIDQFTGD